MTLSPIPPLTPFRIDWFALVPVTFWFSSSPVHSLTIHTTLLCKAAEHFRSLTSQSTCSLDTCKLLSVRETLSFILLALVQASPITEPQWKLPSLKTIQTTIL
ncbi:hypothetical protein FJTKL_09848 [Diaporthe vaccinii]|uniref:Uncharacterized protein n=1 Tax=Diaporthe vaccinii TaxID=105482 RepID=A0ABR4EML5_9PEZI